MKKALSLIIALVFALTLLPVGASLAENKPAFDFTVEQVENEPTEALDEWNVSYNKWQSVENGSKIAVGDTVTLAISYTVPAAIDGIDERLSASLELVSEISGLDGITLVEAQGCPLKLDCDYEIGICMPVEGEYENVSLDNNVCTVMAQLDTSAVIVLRGTANAETVSVKSTLKVGQYRFPALFSLASVDKSEANGAPSYNVHWSDFTSVQKRSVEFRKVEGAEGYTAFAALNNHYYRLNTEGGVREFIPVDESFNDAGEALSETDELTATLNDIYDQVIGFFSIGDAFEISDASFLPNDAASAYETSFSFGAKAEAQPDETAVATAAPEENKKQIGKLLSVLIPAIVVIAIGIVIAVIARKKK